MTLSVRRDFSECDILWFSANQTYDPGSFVEGHQPVSSTGTWLSGGRWLYSGRKQNDVVSCSWRKVVEGSDTTGVCMVQLKSDKGWEDVIIPGDALFVFMTSYAGTKNRKTVLTSIVFVDTVGATTSVDNNGATIRTIMVSARDVTKIFAETSTIFDPALAAIDQFFYTPAFIERADQRFGLSPLEMVFIIIDILYNAIPNDTNVAIARYIQMQWRFPGVEQVPIASLIDFSTFVQAPMFGYCVSSPVDFTSAGSALSLIQAYQNDCVNELFFDIRDFNYESVDAARYQEDIASAFIDPTDTDRQRKQRDDVALRMKNLAAGFTSSDAAPATSTASTIITDNGDRQNSSALAMVFRQRPYDTNTFMRLPLSVVDETEVLQFSPTRSYQDVFNFFHVNAAPTLPMEMQELTFGIKVNPKSISRFGLRRRDIETRYPFSTRAATEDWSTGKSSMLDLDTTFLYYIDLISTWEAFNERFLAGSLVCNFRPDIRVGTRLQFNFKVRGSQCSQYYYVQGVRHAYSENPGSSQSVLTLVRGFAAGVDISSAPEANLFWTKEGGVLPVINPYEIFTKNGFNVAPNSVENKDQNPLITLTRSVSKAFSNLFGDNK